MSWDEINRGVTEFYRSKRVRPPAVEETKGEPMNFWQLVDRHIDAILAIVFVVIFFGFILLGLLLSPVNCP